MIFDHESPEYAESWNKLGGDKYNGAYYYAKEIVKFYKDKVEKANENRS